MLTSHFKYNEKDLNEALKQTYKCDLNTYLESGNATINKATKTKGGTASGAAKVKTSTVLQPAAKKKKP